MLKSNHSSSFKIFFGLLAGVLLGIVTAKLIPVETQKIIVKYVTQPVGTAFLRALFMVVVPLVFSSLVVGVAELGTPERLGRLGKKLGIFYLSTTLMAVLFGQALVNIFKPGVGVSPQFVENARSSLESQTSGLMLKSEAVNQSLWPGLVEKIIPKNILEEFVASNMLGIIFVAIILGMALLTIDRSRSEATLKTFAGISDAMIKIVGWVMSFAPLAVACLMFNAILQFDVQILGQVAKYVAVVIVGYAIHFFGFYSLLIKFLIKIPVGEFYRRNLPVFVTAFSTSSSNATLPTTIKVMQEKFGVPEKITTFTAPLGATVNMDGTALFEMVAAIFIAQVFGIELSLLDHLTLLILVIITSVGVAGVPGGSIPLLMSAMAMVGIPPEGIALILGVDRLLDMGRTVVNVTGDTIGCLYLARVEKVDLNAYLKKVAP